MIGTLPPNKHDLIDPSWDVWPQSEVKLPEMGGGNNSKSI